MSNFAASPSSRIFAQGVYETKTMLKNGEQLMLLIAFPLMALVALRFTGMLDSWATAHQVSRLDVAVPGVLALCVMSTALSGQGIATGFDRRYGVLRFLSTTPLGRGGLMAGKILAVVMVMIVQFIIIVLAALLLGWSPNISGLFMSIPTLLLGAAAFTSLGLLIAGTVRAEATLAIVNMAWVVLAGVGGVLIPSSYLPGFLEWIPNILPSGALGEALRAELMLTHFEILPHIILLIWTLIVGAIALKKFKWSA